MCFRDKTMTLKEIVQKYLQDNGFKGLAGENCGCGLDDLMPCAGCGDNPSPDCVPAMHRKCEGCPVKDSEEGCEFQDIAESGCYRPVEDKRVGK